MEPIEPIDYFEAPTGMTGIILAFVLIFFAFIGFEDMANVAEEVRKPKKTIPRAIILSIVITGIIYILVSLASIRILNWENLALSSAPLADVAHSAIGVNGSITLSLIALFATASTVLITLVANARILYGMAKSNSLPKFLCKVHPKTKTPWLAVIGTLVASVGFAFVGDIVVIANIVVFAVVITFAAINLAVIVLRYTEPVLERPFRVPVNVGKFPVLPLFGFGTTIYMALQFEVEVILVGLVIIAIGSVLYVILKRRKDFMNSD